MTDTELHERLQEILKQLNALSPVIEQAEMLAAVYYKRAIAAEKRIAELEAQLAGNGVTVPLS